MVHGTINKDRLSKVLEQIFSERDGGKFKITIISKENKEEKNQEKTA